MPRKPRKPAIEIVDDNVAEPLTQRDRETLADVVDSYRAGHTTRRRFIVTGTAFGVSMTSLSALRRRLRQSPNQRSEGDGTAAARPPSSRSASPSTPTRVDPQAFKTIPGYYMLANLYDQLIDFEPAPGEDGILVADGDQTAPMIASSMEALGRPRTFTFKLEPEGDVLGRDADHRRGRQVHVPARDRGHAVHESGDGHAHAVLGEEHRRSSTRRRSRSSSTSPTRWPSG